MVNYALAGRGGTASYALILVNNDEIGAYAKVRKVRAAVIVSLGVALVPIADQAFAGSARALLPTAAWGSYGGLSVGPYGGLNVGPYSSPYTKLYVDVNRFTCTFDIPWDLAHRGPPIPNPPEPPLAPAARAQSCVPQTVTVPGSDGKDQTITMVRC